MKMKRMLGSIAVSAGLVLALTGCMTIEMNVSLNSDGETADISSVISYNKAKLELIAPGEDICKKLQDDASSEEAKESIVWAETEESCIATYKRKVVSYDESGITTKSEKSNPLIDPESLVINKRGDTATVSFSFGDEGKGLDSETEGVTVDQILDGFNLSVNFPGKVESANLDGKISEDGKKVTWNLDSIQKAIDTGESLTATGQISSPFSMTPILVVGGIILLIGAGAAVTVVAVRKKKATPVTTL